MNHSQNSFQNKTPNQISLKLLLPLLASILAISPLAIDMYLPAMPMLADSLSTDMPMVQNSLSIYLLGYALGLLFFGPLADKYSRRLLVFIGIGGFVIASLILPFSENIEEFLILRFVQAFVSSAATVIVPGTIREYYGKNMAKGFSYVSMIMMVAPMIAPSIGALLLILHSWQLIFYVLAAYSLIVLILVVKYLPEAKNIENRVSMSFITRYKIVLTHQKARLDLISSMMISLAFFTYITAIPFVYLTVFETSEFTFSILFAINVFALMTAHLINSKLVVRKGSRAMLSYGLLLSIIASTALVVVSYWQLSLIFTLLTVIPLMGSISMVAVNADSLVLLEFAEQSGTATAVIGTLRFGIGALAGPILALFYDGSALPFALLMWSSVLVVLLCQVLIKVKQLK
ncbi:MAG: multidrug effflux MFS transporter [Colwellia sp.]|nr:multidrug effflux MFS transporter [Colwellia sp.]